jgi:spore coat polysaccharide biosynthesis predicted glycosyltransferase SpsG
MKVFIITEGNAQTGYGHLTRCLSIYQGFEEHDITPTFVANCDENGKKVLGNILLQAFDWIENQDKLFEMISGADIAIIDSYLADLALYVSIYKSVKKTVYFDDTLRIDYPPGTIINGAVNAEFLPYAMDDRHSYLLGLDYTPMRKAFWDIPERIQKEKIEDVLITIGGIDTRGVTSQVLEAVRNEFPHLIYHVVIGFINFNENREKYDQFDNIFFYHSLDEYEMRELMIKCDLAISAAGQTTYELIRTATPSIFIQIVDNQQNNIQGWHEKQVINQIITINDDTYLQKVVLAVEKYILPGELEFSGNGVEAIVKRVIA